MDDREDRVRERAFALWKHEGSLSGRAEQHWRQAEAEIDAEDRAAAPAPLAEPAAPPKLTGVRPAKP